MENTDNYQIIKNIRSVKDFKFSDNTTYGIGGYAKIAYYPETESEAVELFKYLKEIKENFTILGNGSNVLASDNFYNGAVISTKNLKKIAVKDDSIYCQCGVTVSQLLNFCLNNGLGGYEYLAGIPATIGGLTIMNGGIPSRHIGEDILSVYLFDGELNELPNKNCNFGNKHSTMRDINSIVLSVVLSKFAVSREASLQRIEKNISLRRNQPVGKTCGCVFKNPEGLSAGKLIDEAGLKSLSVGGARVSPIHANFIESFSAKSSDVKMLINSVKRRVFEVFGILLEEEVIYIGEFNEVNS